MANMTDYDANHYLMFKVQDELLRHVLPAMQLAADNITDFVRDAEDDEEIVNSLREAAVELLIDELVKVLTRDPQAVSKFYMLRNDGGLNIDTLIACYTELGPESARRYFARTMDMTADEHARAAREMPQTLEL
jgi:hypothetical protein